MTVDEAIKELQKLSEEGFGDYEVKHMNGLDIIQLISALLNMIKNISLLRYINETNPIANPR